jgi:hypothetical protein
MKKAKKIAYKKAKESKEGAIALKYYTNLIKQGIKEKNIITSITRLGVSEMPISNSPMRREMISNGKEVTIIVIATPGIPISANEISQLIEVQRIVNF